MPSWHDDSAIVSDIEKEIITVVYVYKGTTIYRVMFNYFSVTKYTCKIDDI